MLVMYTDLANRLQRFASLEIDHCIKTTIITTIITVRLLCSLLDMER